VAVAADPSGGETDFIYRQETLQRRKPDSRLSQVWGGETNNLLPGVIQLYFFIGTSLVI
jgi:hypothetical protein